MSYGRRIIYSDATEITIENVAEEVRKAVLVHDGNRNDIQRLYDYYRGKTSILGKEKETRPEINHKVNENRAYEIVSFHKGYTFGEAIQYVRRENASENDNDEAIASDINALNGYMADADKAACDNKIAEWMYICGAGYRLTLPNKGWSDDGDDAPFKLYALDPRKTFVVYSSSVDERPLMGVCIACRENNERVFSVYTENSYFEFTEFGLDVRETPHTLGMIPVVEYPADNARLGVFEVVMPLLDALDELQSNRMDDIVQYVNSFLAIMGAQLDDETYKKLNEWKTLCLPEGTDAKFLSPTMSQSDVQTLKDDLYQSILTITCTPNRNGGSSTSDTGTAVIYRDGFVTAESKAKATELEFKRAEKWSLRLALRILRDTVGTKLRLTDIVTHFTRRNYENIATKSQVLIAMLNNPKIHPELAFAHCGMFPDPESAYLQSMAYYEEQMEKWEPIEVTEDVSKPGSSTGNKQEKNPA